MNNKKRIEFDSIGSKKIDKSRLWGAQTQRSLENFKIGNEKIPKEIINIAKNLIIDISGVTFAGSRTKSASLIYNLAKETYLEVIVKLLE